MAKVRYGATVTGITGSIGGWTFSSNRSGNIIRTRGFPSKSSTQKQTTSHQAFISLLNQWQTVSFANKTLWDAFALANTKTTKFGDVRTLTGLNWYQSINSFYVLLGQAVIDAPPAHVLPPAVQAFNVSINATSIKIFFTPDFNPANSGLIIESTPLLTRVTSSVRSNFRFTKIITAGPVGTIDLTSDWETAHNISYPPGASPTNGQIFIMIRTIEKTSGIASTGLINSDSFVTGEEGIGFWAIGGDFIVQ